MGRPMKAGKEAVVGAIAALRRWMALDHAEIARAVDLRADELAERLSGIPGLVASRVPDETGNPFSRVHLTIDAARRRFQRPWSRCRTFAPAATGHSALASGRSGHSA